VEPREFSRPSTAPGIRIRISNVKSDGKVNVEEKEIPCSLKTTEGEMLVFL
jgi:hypothetical protein